MTNARKNESIFLVEVYDNRGRLFKRRVTDSISKIADWVENAIIKNWCLYENNYKLRVDMDDYGCGEIAYHPSNCESEVVFRINTVNIGRI